MSKFLLKIDLTAEDIWCSDLQQLLSSAGKRIDYSVKSGSFTSEEFYIEVDSHDFLSLFMSDSTTIKGLILPLKGGY